MGLTVHVDARSDLLADSLGQLLSRPAGGVLSRELVVVAAKGVERWLTQRLSHVLGADEHGNGVCAGVDFVRPATLIGLLTGSDETDPWDPDQLVWPVLTVIDASMSERWCDALARHLGKGREGDAYELRQERRWTVARRLAGLFATYARDRPTMLEDWAAGGDGDGAGGQRRPRPRLAARAVAPRRRDHRRADPRRAAPRDRRGHQGRRHPRPARPALPLRLHPARRHRARARRRCRGGARGAPLAAGALPHVLAHARAGRRRRTDQAPDRPRGRARPASPHRRPGPRRAGDATRPDHRGRDARGRAGDPAYRDARHPARLATARPAHRHRARPRHPRHTYPGGHGHDRAGARHPRHPPPGRGAARRAHRPAPGRPHPRAARHHRHVP